MSLTPFFALRTRRAATHNPALRRKSTLTPVLDPSSLEFQKVEYGRKFARDLDAPLRLIPGGEHFTSEDHPNIIADEIMKLVKTVHGLNADMQ
jgi:pimeloyl-ACP methyl ester carboxylesterase